MLTPLETITVDTEKLYCDGGGRSERLRGAQSEPANEASGHPRVFLTMTKDGSVDCPYCGRHFVLAAGAKKSAGH